MARRAAVVPVIDVRIEDHGSIMLFCPQSDEARDWLVEHTDGMWFGDALAVEPRYAAALADAAWGEGLVCG